jgi:4-hydroxy-3-polyprenylbenzoate decarboxylase
MNAVWATHIGKYIKFLVVVDDDVNIYDPNALIWAISMRVQPHRDLVLETNSTSIQLDPSASHLGVTSKLGIDATEKLPEEGSSTRLKTDSYRPFGEHLLAENMPSRVTKVSFA